LRIHPALPAREGQPAQEDLVHDAGSRCSIG